MFEKIKTLLENWQEFEGYTFDKDNLRWFIENQIKDYDILVLHQSIEQYNYNYCLEMLTVLQITDRKTKETLLLGITWYDITNNRVTEEPEFEFFEAVAKEITQTIYEAKKIIMKKYYTLQEVCDELSVTKEQVRLLLEFGYLSLDWEERREEGIVDLYNVKDVNTCKKHKNRFLFLCEIEQLKRTIKRLESYIMTIEN